MNRGDSIPLSSLRVGLNRPTREFSFVFCFFFAFPLFFFLLFGAFAKKKIQTKNANIRTKSSNSECSFTTKSDSVSRTEFEASFFVDTADIKILQDRNEKDLEPSQTCV